MTMYMIILTSFFLSFLLAAFTPVHPAAYGCLLPIVATIAMILVVLIWPDGSSTQPMAIGFLFLFVALGSIPGAMSGAGLRQLLPDRDG